MRVMALPLAGGRVLVVLALGLIAATMVTLALSRSWGGALVTPAVPAAPAAPANDASAAPSIVPMPLQPPGLVPARDRPQATSAPPTEAAPSKAAPGLLPSKEGTSRSGPAVADPGSPGTITEEAPAGAPSLPRKGDLGN